MNTQNTPVHIKLWHREFWLMAIANLMLSMSAYILIPTLPLWLFDAGNFSAAEVAVSMGVFGIGLYALGGFCSFLVQHYRRNAMCMWAIGAIAVCLAVMYYMNNVKCELIGVWTVIALRFLTGAFYGLAQMILTSTLIIDTSESFQRTEANYSAAWFSRFALSLGPIAGLILYRIVGFNGVLIASACCALTAIILIKIVKFPFRAPEDHIHLWSLDRFFLTHGLWLFVNLMLITTVVGLVMSMALNDWFYAIMMAGFFLAILSQRFAFREAELKSEVVTGLILMIASLLVMFIQQGGPISYISPLFIGMGIGIIGARFLLFFIKLSRHCQRGTSQSMFMLGWESGLAFGLAAGYGCFHGNEHDGLLTAIALTVVALLFYNYFTHNWFIRHKNR